MNRIENALRFVFRISKEQELQKWTGEEPEQSTGKLVVNVAIKAGARPDQVLIAAARGQRHAILFRQEVGHIAKQLDDKKKPR